MMIDLKQHTLDITQSREVKQVEYSAQLTTCRFSPCGKFICAGAFDGTVQRWNLQLDDHPRVGVKFHDGWVQDLVFHPDGKRILSVDTWGKLCCWNYADENPQPLWTVEQAHAGWIRSVDVSPDGAIIATGGNDRAVRLWSAADGQPAGEFCAHEQHVHTVAFHPDGKHLAIGDLKGRVIVWSLAEMTTIREMDATALHNTLGEGVGTYLGGGVRGMAFSPDGGKLLCSGITELGASVVKGFPAVMQFDWMSGTLDATLRPHNHTAEFGTHGLITEDVRFHRQGFLVGCGGNGEREGAIWFWKLGQSEPLFEIKGNPGSRSIDLHPDGLRMAVSQFKENGRGINGGNGRHAGIEEYHDHHGLIRIYVLTAKEKAFDDPSDQKPQ